MNFFTLNELKFKRIVRLAYTLLIVNILGVSAAYSQGVAVSGVVNDSNGEPVAGVTVQVQNSNTAAITDGEGRYSLRVPGTNSVLVFSSFGYEDQETVVGSRTTVNVVMVENATGIEEVVVTALGIKRDTRALGYAISTVKGTDMVVAGNTVNPLTTLYGKAAGVGIQSGVAGPMGGVNIKIRGAGSLSSMSSTRPLFVVDGVPIYDNDSDMSSRDYDPLNSFDYGSGINDINPEDIESMEILKGAKASILYGSKGANGVVLITTKRGATTRGLGVTVSYQHTWEQPHSYIEWQNEYGEGESLTWGTLPEGQTVRKISNSRFNFGPRFDSSQKIQFYDGKEYPYQAYPDNFMDLFRTGSSDTFNAAISGGNEKGSMRLSYTKKNYNGLMTNNWLKENTVSFSGQMNVSKFASFEVTNNLYVTDTHNRMSNWQDITRWGVHRGYDYNLLKSIYLTEDGYLNEALYNEGGLPDSSRAMISRWIQQEHNSNLDSKMHNITSARATLHFTPWLYLVGTAGIDYTDTDYTRKDPIMLKDPLRGGRYSYKRENSFVQNYNATLTFDQSYLEDRLSVEAFVGYEFNSVKESMIFVSTGDTGLKYPGWYSLNNASSFPGMAEASKVRQHTRGSEAMYGVFGMLTVGWKGTYYLEFQARNDWNSTLPPKNNSYFYPGVSFNWNFSDDVKIPYLNYGKLFTSFADVGRGANRYFALKSYDISSVPLSPDVSTVSGPADLFAGDLLPERKREFELGLSSRWLNNRVELNYSFYVGNTYDQIMPVPLAGPTGAANIRINAGNVKHWGHELYVKGTPIQTKDWKWDVIFTLASQRSKVVKLYPGISRVPKPSDAGYAVVAEVGDRDGEILMYDYLRDDDGNRIVGANGLYSLNTNAGMKSTGKNVNPDAFGGIMTDLFWKGAFLHIGLDYKFGGTIFSNSNYYLTGLGQGANTLKYRDESHGGIAYYVNGDGQRVRTEHSSLQGPSGETVYHNGMILPGVKDNGDGTYSANDIIANSTSYYQSYLSDMSSTYLPDGLFKNDYIKLREISIGYTLPKRWSDMLKLQKVTVQLNARNLFYLYKTLPNLDAESALGTSGQSAYHEQSYLPTARSYGFGVNISF